MISARLLLDIRSGLSIKLPFPIFITTGPGKSHILSIITQHQSISSRTILKYLPFTLTPLSTRSLLTRLTKKRLPLLNYTFKKLRKLILVRLTLEVILPLYCTIRNLLIRTVSMESIFCGLPNLSTRDAAKPEEPTMSHSFLAGSKNDVPLDIPLKLESAIKSYSNHGSSTNCTRRNQWPKRSEAC